MLCLTSNLGFIETRLDDGHLIKDNMRQAFEVSKDKLRLYGKKVILKDGTDLKISSFHSIILDQQNNVIHLSLLGEKNVFLRVNTSEETSHFTAINYEKPEAEIQRNNLIRLFLRQFPEFKADRAVSCSKGIFASGSYMGNSIQLCVFASQYQELLAHASVIHKRTITQESDEAFHDDVGNCLTEPLEPLDITYGILNSSSTRRVGNAYIIDNANQIVNITLHPDKPNFYEVKVYGKVLLTNAQLFELCNPVKVVLELDNNGIITLTELDNNLSQNSLIIDVRKGAGQVYYIAYDSRDKLPEIQVAAGDLLVKKIYAL